MCVKTAFSSVQQEDSRAPLLSARRGPGPLMVLKLILVNRLSCGRFLLQTCRLGRSRALNKGKKKPLEDEQPVDRLLVVVPD